MIHVYKAGATYELDGKKYDIACINEKDKEKYLADGWVTSLEAVKKTRAKKKVAKDGD